MSRRILSALAALALLLALAACGQGGEAPETQTPPQASGPELRYTNTLFGYTLDLPEAWAGHYAVQEFVSGVAVSNTDNEELGGMLFTIEWTTSEDWHDTWRDGEDAPMAVRFLAEQDGLVLYVYHPSDMQYDPGDAGKTEIYQTMRGEADAALDTFALTGEAFPEIRTGRITVADGGQITLEGGESCPIAGNLAVCVNGEDGTKTELPYEDFQTQLETYRGRTFQLYIKDGAIALLNEIWI